MAREDTPLSSDTTEDSLIPGLPTPSPAAAPRGAVAGQHVRSGSGPAAPARAGGTGRPGPDRARPVRQPGRVGDISLTAAACSSTWRAWTSIRSNTGSSRGSKTVSSSPRSPPSPHSSPVQPANGPATPDLLVIDHPVVTFWLVAREPAPATRTHTVTFRLAMSSPAHR